MSVYPFEIALWVLTSSAIVFLLFFTVALCRALGVLGRMRATLDVIAEEVRATAEQVREAADRHARPTAGPRPAGSRPASGDGPRSGAPGRAAPAPGDRPPARPAPPAPAPPTSRETSGAEQAGGTVGSEGGAPLGSGSEN